MARTHNKKRNVGVIYELISSEIARSIVEKNNKKLDTCIKLVKKHFREGSELYKEFRLFNALNSTSGLSENVANSVINESKAACREYNQQKLDREKSRLIREINYTLKPQSNRFYDQDIKDYKKLATIQCLLDHWRGNKPLDIKTSALYEQKITNALVATLTESLEQPDVGESNNLIVNLMTKKVNEKYSDKFDAMQKKIIKTYIYESTDPAQSKKLKEMIGQVKKSVISLLENYKNLEDNKYIQEKIGSVENQIISESFDKFDDNTIEKALIMCNLKRELESEL